MLAKHVIKIALVVLVLTVVTPVTSRSVAQTPEETAANLLYTDGKAAFTGGRYTEALTLFQQAYEVLQNDFIRFYLGRTHTALGQCDKALDHFTGLTQQLPPGPRFLRRTDEVGCRLRLAAEYLDGYRCHEALVTLAPIARQLEHPDERRRYGALHGTARLCTDVFGTRTAIGQRAARLYAESRKALRAGKNSRALDLAQQSLAAKRSGPGAAVEAIALGKLARCKEAISKLTPAIPHAAADDAHVMGRLDVKCRIAEGKRLLKGGPCQAVLDMLDPLKGKLKGADETWRRQKVAWCRPRATEFLTDTPARQAAYKLFLAARKARKGTSSKGIARATALYRKALKLIHEPLIRRELARNLVVSDGCPAAVAQLSKLSTEVRTSADQALLDACGRYAPPATTEATVLGAHVDGLVEVARLRTAGAHADAIAHLKTLALAETASLQGLRLDLLYDAGRCDEYAQALAVVEPTVRSHVTAPDTRVDECRPPAPVSTPPPEVADAGSTDTVTAVASSEGGSDTLAWVSLGSGAALAGAGVAFAVMWADTGDRHERARAAYLQGTGDAALAARDEMSELAAKGPLYSGLALGLGIAGAAAVTTGLILMLSGDDPAASTDAGTARFYPLVGPNHVGIGGQF